MHIRYFRAAAHTPPALAAWAAVARPSCPARHAVSFAVPAQDSPTPTLTWLLPVLPSLTAPAFPGPTVIKTDAARPPPLTPALYFTGRLRNAHAQ
jgi:hypothetical protein